MTWDKQYDDLMTQSLIEKNSLKSRVVMSSNSKMCQFDQNPFYLHFFAMGTWSLIVLGPLNFIAQLHLCCWVRGGGVASHGRKFTTFFLLCFHFYSSWFAKSLYIILVVCVSICSLHNEVMKKKLCEIQLRSEGQSRSLTFKYTHIF